LRHLADNAYVAVDLRGRPASITFLLPSVHRNKGPAVRRQTHKDVYMKTLYLRDKFSIGDKSLDYLINVIFGLFFFFPVVGFIAFAVRYDMLHDKYLPLFFLGVLGFSLSGLILLRRVFGSLSWIARRRISGQGRPAADSGGIEAADLNSILHTFHALDARCNSALEQLREKSTANDLVRELAEFCCASADPQEIFAATLERAMTLSGAAAGSVLLLDKKRPRQMVVTATCGTASDNIGACCQLNNTVIVQALINKTAMLVEDVAEDGRFQAKDLPHAGCTSCICMPIRSRRRIIGVLALSGGSEQPLTAATIRALTPLVSSAAFAVDNLKLQRESRRARGYLQGIGRLCNRVVDERDGNDLLHNILLDMQRMIPLDAAVVLSLDDGPARLLRVAELLGRGPAGLSAGARITFEKGDALDRIVGRPKMTILDKKDHLPPVLEAFMGAFSVRGSRLALPLKVRQHLVGVLLCCMRGTSILSGWRVTLPWVASLLAVSMERRQLLRDVARRDRELETIRHVGSALASSTFDLKQVLKYTMDMIRVTINVEAGFLFLTRDSELEFAVALNVEMAPLKNLRLKLGQGIAGYVAARGEPILINDISSSPHFFPEIDEAAGFTTRSVLCVPMISQGRVIGVLELLNKLESRFSAADTDLIQSIAASVSIAIENAHLYRKMVSMAESERSIRQMFQKFVPKKVVDHILRDAQGNRLLIEDYRTLTLLNIDIRGFSNLSRKLGARRTVSLLNYFFSVMGGIVFNHHGIVDKYLGDGFLALFGAPVVSPDDADNAVAAALKMQAELASVNSRLAADYGLTLEVGISLHSGEVVVGNIGFEMKMDYTVIGEAVNDVFRLQELCKSFPHSILISESTYRATSAGLTVKPANTGASPATGRMQVYELMGFQNSQTAESNAAVIGINRPAPLPAATRI